MHFRQRGKIIGSLDFAHLVFDIQLTDLTDKVKETCQHTKDAYEASEGREGGTYYFKDTLGNYNERCHILEQDLTDQEHIWFEGKLDDSIHRPNRATAVVTDEHPRDKRQIFFGLGILLVAGVVAISSYYFSDKSLMDISVGSNQNPITIRTLQDHETRITVNERSVQVLKDNVAYLKESEAQFKHNFETMHLVHRIDTALKIIEDSMTKILDGMHSLHQHRLSPKLVDSEQLLPMMSNMKTRLSTIGRKMISSNVEDLFRYETSHVIFNNGTIRIFVHIPMYKPDSLLDLFEYVPSPISIGDQHFMFPEPEDAYLAVNKENTLFRPFPTSDLTLCSSIGEIYYCKNSNWYLRRFQSSCLPNLYLFDTDRIVANCEFSFQEKEDYLVQLDHESFVLFQGQEGLVQLDCPESVPHTMEMSFKGAYRFHIQSGCRIKSSNFAMDGTTNLFLDPNQIKIRELNLLQQLPLKEIEEKFHNLHPKALKLVGSKEGLKIKDIVAEFKRQHMTTIFTLGVLPGIVMILVCVLFFLCYCKGWCCFGRRRRAAAEGQVHIELGNMGARRAEDQQLLPDQPPRPYPPANEIADHYAREFQQRRAAYDATAPPAVLEPVNPV